MAFRVGKCRVRINDFYEEDSSDLPGLYPTSQDWLAPWHCHTRARRPGGRVVRYLQVGRAAAGLGRAHAGIHRTAAACGHPLRDRRVFGREVPARSNRAVHHPGGRGFVSRRVAAGPIDTF
jgi:hypothetical protein